MAADGGAWAPDMRAGGTGDSGLWPNAWPVMGERPAADVILSCTGLSAPACTAMEEALTARLGTAPTRRDGPAQHTPGPVTVSLEMIREEETFLIGRLVWSEGGAAPETGPTIEISVMDATVSQDSYDRLVAALLRRDDLPF